MGLQVGDEQFRQSRAGKSQGLAELEGAGALLPAMAVLYLSCHQQGPALRDYLEGEPKFSREQSVRTATYI